MNPRDAFIYMPGAIRAEQDTVQALVLQLDADIKASNVTASFGQAWALFVAEWKHFYDEQESWWARSYIASYEKTLEYRRRVLDWRTAFIGQGGHATGPTPATSPDATSESRLGTYLTIGGAAIAGGVLLGWWASSKRSDEARRRT